MKVTINGASTIIGHADLVIEGIASIFKLLTELLPSFEGKNRNHNRKTTDSKITDIANCKSCKTLLPTVEYMILVIYYSETEKTRAFNKMTDGLSGQPTKNPSHLDRVGDLS